MGRPKEFRFPGVLNRCFYTLSEENFGRPHIAAIDKEDGKPLLKIILLPYGDLEREVFVFYYSDLIEVCGKDEEAICRLVKYCIAERLQTKSFWAAAAAGHYKERSLYQAFNRTAPLTNDDIFRLTTIIK